jgi:hypothetical protein
MSKSGTRLCFLFIFSFLGSGSGFNRSASFLPTVFAPKYLNSQYLNIEQSIEKLKFETLAYELNAPLVYAEDEMLPTPGTPISLATESSVKICKDTSELTWAVKDTVPPSEGTEFVDTRDELKDKLFDGQCILTGKSLASLFTALSDKTLKVLPTEVQFKHLIPNYLGTSVQDISSSKILDKISSLTRLLKRLNSYDVKILKARINGRLLKYRDHIESVAYSEGLPASLLAALSYQESKWNPWAKSYTGVRGFMQLTLATAKHMGVKNRLNWKQSVKGGARYLKYISKYLYNKRKVSQTALSLMAYNMGPGHIVDMIDALEKGEVLTSDAIWVIENILKKRQPAFYKRTRFGFARGDEGQHFVAKVFSYRHVIEYWQSRTTLPVAQNKKSKDLQKPS